MDLGLTGRSALITGASQGIGRAIALSLAKEGCHLHLAARDDVALRTLAESIRAAHGVQATTHAVDLTKRGAAVELAEACPDVDILVNNAGNTPRGTLLDIDEDAWRSGWELKIFGYINLTRALYARMTARRSGVVVNVIGIGAERLEYGYTAGSTGNAALVAFTRTVGGMSLEQGVRVMGVSPGWVETEKVKRTLRQRASIELGDAERWAELAADFPRGHLIRPEEIADVVTFVCSARASAMSGHVVSVDAGFASRGYTTPRAKR